MSWYDEAWGRRWPIIVDNSAGGTSAIDVSIVVPSQFPDFWDYVDSAGADIRVTAADGVTLQTYQLSGFDFANRVVTIELDNVTPPAASEMFVLWLYYGNSGASSAAGSFTASTPLTGYIHPGQTIGPIVRGDPPAPGSTEPAERLQKTSSEVLYAWVDMRRVLEKFATKFEDSLAYEEVQSIDLDALNNGSDEASERTLADIRMVNGPLIRINHTGGSDSDDRTLSLTVTTTLGRVLNPRVLLNVRDIDEV